MGKTTIKNIQKILKIDEAFGFYKKFIFNDEKLSLLKKHGFSAVGSVPFTDWELFASILVGENSSEGYGADLANFEVKSAKIKSSFEYQYHKFTGLDKLKEDMIVNHLFISYSEAYDEVIVRVVTPEKIKEKFVKWEKGLKENYRDGSVKQRFRKSVAYGFVEAEGEVIVHIENGVLSF